MLNGVDLEERWSGTRIRKSWHPKILAVLYTIDAIAIIATLIFAHLASFGLKDALVLGRVDISWNYFVVGPVIGLFWFVALQISGSRNVRHLGQGNDEYRLVTKATTYFFCLIAIFSYLTQIDFARSYIIIAYPLGLLLLLGARWSLRRWLVSFRLRGRALTRVMIISDASSGEHLYTTLKGAQQSGLSPAAFYFSGSAPGADIEKDHDLPILGYSHEASDIIAAAREANIHAVALGSGHGLTPQELRRLGWELAAWHISLILAPAMTDIAGPRINTQPLNGVPLIHVSTPRMEGFPGFLKRTIDILASGFGLILLSPLLLVIALLVKKDGGPIFFFQERVGYRGGSFHMVKFRSMVTNAEELKKDLMAQNEGNGVLFKMANDPRITPIGRFIRKYSIDELPQLWNVFIGDMSLVGPRPPLLSEVEQYEEDAYRRLLVKPGITGLWQVSGRSDLSWEESIRLDLYYVENWSVIGDFIILFRTFRAVFAKDGAY
ncbi:MULTISPECIES: sugar transferase [unclassified Rothia (in: high G+C Gram-positive bacteria)]|uniref:sugar transferase n=1 Tax=unclassified Rothia (in: high G+C Gram-positive bacteria) TaxID=2689056 RepID=UPI00195D3B44|nr:MULTISPECIES: sugar transferase [unclassified Rothia (in: high G+C Gram-positive bacteria)]MBM7051187.1 sugar transferase [Rothia sp. ZJ1223]QRZ62117.1 sugar transferase [Rothia sp. ZJ932]